MPATPRGLPYPTPDDPVALGASDIRALADAVQLILDSDLTLGASLTLADGRQLIFAPDASLAHDTAAAIRVADHLTANGALAAGWYVVAPAFLTPASTQKALWAPTAGDDWKLIGGSTLVTIVEPSPDARINFGATYGSVLTVLSANGEEFSMPGVTCGCSNIDGSGFYIRAHQMAGGYWFGPLRVNWIALVSD